jgi:hypothetical protein
MPCKLFHYLRAINMRTLKLGRKGFIWFFRDRKNLENIKDFDENFTQIHYHNFFACRFIKNQKNLFLLLKLSKTLWRPFRYYGSWSLSLTGHVVLKVLYRCTCPRRDDSLWQRRPVPGPGEGEGRVSLHRLTGGPGTPTFSHTLPETGTPTPFQNLVVTNRNLSHLFFAIDEPALPLALFSTIHTEN